MKRILGYVRWYDKSGDDGILCDFKGNEYYFNSHSFESSKWGATGICKKTGKKKTIRTRFYPGLFLVDGYFPGPECEKITHDTPVEFEQAKGTEQRWAVKIKIKDTLENRILVWETQVFCLLDSMTKSENEFKNNWYEYYERRLNSFLERALNDII